MHAEALASQQGKVREGEEPEADQQGQQEGEQSGGPARATAQQAGQDSNKVMVQP